MGEEKNPQYVLLGVFPYNGRELCLKESSGNESRYDLFIGCLDKREKLFQALKRILKAETGLDASGFESIGLTESDWQKRKLIGGVTQLIAGFKADVGPETGSKLKIKTGCKWLELDGWMKLGKEKFTPYAYELLQELKKSSQKDEYENSYKRALADYQNLLKQAALEKRDWIRFSNESLLTEILPVYANLKLALKHARNSEEKSPLEEGLGYVLKQFKDILENSGVHEIVAEGQPFDHNTMDAAGKVETDEKEKDGLVAEELKSGYMLNGKVIEHAKVTVWEYKNEK
jgi:molecular chaperone GrpE